MEPEVANI